MLAFNDSKFVVAFTGDCAESKVFNGWQAVLAYLFEQTGETYEHLENIDYWQTLGYTIPDADDERFLYNENNEIGSTYIIRITEG